MTFICRGNQYIKKIVFVLFASEFWSLWQLKIAIDFQWEKKQQMQIFEKKKKKL